MDRRDFLKTVAVTGAAVSWATPASAAGYDRKVAPDTTYPMSPELLPFGHAVMSGDPLHDRVVLWTRITIPDPRGYDATLVPDPQGIRSVKVTWVIARDPGLTQVVRKGRVTTTAARDWTVKVDADELPAATTLYYAFEALGFRSPIGRTRTAPLPTSVVTELTIAHLSCSSWWQDVFNAYARVGERNDLDLITHAGDHVYDGSGGHPASRFWKGQRRWDLDIDNGDFVTVAQARRRYALYYQDPALMRAHLAAPFAIMADQHDDDAAGTTLSGDQARAVFWEWTASRPPRPDGSGAFAPSPGPDVNMPTPVGAASQYLYRTLPYGTLAEIVLLDVRRFADKPDQTNKVLGDVQWAWLKKVLIASKARGVTFRYVVNQVNLGQLRGFNLPFAEAFREQFGMDPNAPQGEIYATAWGAHPDDRNALLRFLREQGIVDNVVVSGDSHGFFGYDLTEDPQAPNYEPLTGGGLLGAVGVEMVPSTQGRPGGQDVVAEMLYFGRTNGSRGAAFTDAAGFDSIDRPAALPAAIGIENAAKAANPNLLYFNWKAEYGYTMVHLRATRAVLENFTTPQRVVSPTQTLLAQFSSPVGAPHLGAVLMPTALRGSRQDLPAPPARTTSSSARPGPGTAPTPGPSGPSLPTTGGTTVLAASGLAAGAAAIALHRAGRPSRGES